VIQSFFHLDDFSGLVVRRFTLATYRDLFTRAHADIVLRTVSMAAAVTVADAVLALPLAYYLARYAGPRTRAALTLAVLMPLWSSYLVRVYFWKLILAREGVVSWAFARAGLTPLLDGLLSLPVVGGPSLSVSALGTFVAFVYVWLPYMVLPVAAALERVPRSCLQASADLGARPSQTFRYVTLPLALPGLAAGAIFTFSLTLGDYITPTLVSPNTQFIGNVIFAQHTNNLPLASAFAIVPIVVMVLYLALARRLGAFEHL
jgi:putative spermidine/putrescine transport system permease protein